MKRLFTGIQPTGNLHLGNYLGAIKPLIDNQDKYETLASVVNYHALTNIQDGETLRKNTNNIIIDYIALGLDIDNSTLFVQSDIPELTELTWIFNTLITVPYLSRAHAFKDKIDKGIEPTVGLFDYPVLMASDILAVKGEIIPVGADQKQHIEIARDIARKFNTTFGETFIEPQELINEEVAIIPGIDGQKMSKSYGNTIPLFASKEEIVNCVMKIPTDSKSVDEPKDINSILFKIHSLVIDEKQKEELKIKYQNGGLSYKEAKENLINDLENFISPLREKRQEVVETMSIEDIRKFGKEKVQKIVKPIIDEVRSKTGLSL